MKDQGELIFFESPEDFRTWLDQNHHSCKELWVGYYKKGTGHPSMTWPESVDQALCYGWIDGIRKRIDDARYKIRFTPRKPNSVWSAVNVKKVEEFKALGIMQPAGLEAYAHLKQDKSRIYSYEQKEKAQLPPAYEAKIKANTNAWEFFENLAPSYKKASIFWIIRAKKEETQLRRLAVLIESCLEGRKIPPLRKKGE